jgi:hypothetical protein
MSTTKKHKVFISEPMRLKRITDVSAKKIKEPYIL